MNDLKFTTAGDYMQPAYEPDAGALTPAQVDQIRKLNMNDKIKQYAELSKAYKTILVDGQMQSVLLIDPEKFAELIVLKCAEIADTAEPFLASDLIKQHFGVGSKVNLGSLDQYDDPAWQGKQ